MIHVLHGMDIFMNINLSNKDMNKLDNAIDLYTGPAQVLESAIGTLVVGQMYGLRVLKMCHTHSSLRKYEKILGLKFEDVCPEATEITSRCRGIQIAEKLGGYWKVVRGEVKVENKTHITNAVFNP